LLLNSQTGEFNNYRGALQTGYAGFRQFLFFEKTSPALEKILSQGAEDAGEHKNGSARWYK